MSSLFTHKRFTFEAKTVQTEKATIILASNPVRNFSKVNWFTIQK